MTQREVSHMVCQQTEPLCASHSDGSLSGLSSMWIAWPALLLAYTHLHGSTAVTETCRRTYTILGCACVGKHAGFQLIWCSVCLCCGGVCVARMKVIRIVQAALQQCGWFHLNKPA